MTTVLGLDLGANSIGWALVGDNRILDAGVRVFPAGVDRFDTKRERSKNESRRVARGMRRTVARRGRRKARLRSVLAEAGLLPQGSAEQESLCAELNPYDLRARGLDQPLRPHEFGRALVHLNQRRGFKSNRKTDTADNDRSEILAEIGSEWKAIRDGGHKTIGRRLAAMPNAGDHDQHKGDLKRIRGRHLSRTMFEQEFEQLWSAQCGFDSDTARVLKRDPDLKDRIRSTIFFQREMYWPKSMIGRCELEPKQPRCPRADRKAQRFRLLQEVNNLKYIDEDTGEIRSLDPDQRQLLLEKLERRKELKFDDLRKSLGFLESVKFNLERGERAKLKGMVTDAALANRNIFDKRYWDLPEETRDAIVDAALHETEESALIDRAQREWGLDEEAANRLANLDLPKGYLHLSRVAIEKLLPHMERGLLYMADADTPSALSESGYLNEVATRIQDELPHPPNIPNPVVKQALYELRKVINALLREYRRKFNDPMWKPDAVHVELAREAKASAEERQKMSKRRALREAERDDAADEIRKYASAHDGSLRVTRKRIDMVLLWKEQKHECIYSGRPISPAQLFSGEIDIDHILPYNRTLDNSFDNKVVCFVAENREKRNQTPYEWRAGREPEKYEQMLQRARKLPWTKRRRFIQKELELDSFIARQLNDTRYISRTVVAYVRCLFDQPHKVLCPKGSHTHTLRHMWGLDPILHQTGDSPAWETSENLNPGEKNRADHRHHAIDAIVLALTDHSRLQGLARHVAEDDPLPPPWRSFRDDVQAAIDAINVSHRPRRRARGKLHEETYYGPTAEDGVFVVRKMLEELKPSMVPDIRDETIRGIVMQRLDEKGVQYGRGAGGSIPKEVWQEPLTMPSKVRIKRVRLLRREKTIQPIRNGSAYVKPGSTHHLSFFRIPLRDEKYDYDVVFTSTLEAMKRIRQQHETSSSGSIITTAHREHPNAEFLFSLSQSEMVLLEIDGQDCLYRFDTAASTTKQMWFLPHISALDHGRLSKKPSSLMKMKPRKVTVDPLGRIRWAND